MVAYTSCIPGLINFETFSIFLFFQFLTIKLFCIQFFLNLIRCGHCKSLVPEYEKAASLLKGVVKVVAVDATESPGLQKKYGVEGFPTLKIFGQVSTCTFTINCHVGRSIQC